MNDLGASILARLKNKSTETKISYQQCIQLFFQEEFLRRFSSSKYSRNFVLKGGHFIYALTHFKSRPTVDIDFLLRDLNGDLDHLDKVMAEILGIPTGYNEVVMLNVKRSRRISLQREYPGVSVQITGQIKNVRVLFDVDVGIGDVISPTAEKRFLPTQLEGYSTPEIFTYSLESTIAEKLDAVLQRFELTSRMKDFYDIYQLSVMSDFEGKVLCEAILQTLVYRRTHFDADSLDRIQKLSFDGEMLIKWRYFLRTIQRQELLFTDVIQGIVIFLHPIWAAITNDCDMLETWDCKSRMWIRN